MHPAIFIDRDGVIIENCPDYVRSWSDVRPLPAALTALAEVATSPYRVVIVTNQSGVGRGLFSLETALDINRRVVALIQAAGGRIDGAYLCPHAPEEGCACRKPQPGLLLQAAHELELDLGRSLMIGDALSDVQAGLAAGIPINALVRTGRGAAQSELPAARTLPSFHAFDDLQHALHSLVPEAPGRE